MAGILKFLVILHLVDAFVCQSQNVKYRGYASATSSHAAAHKVPMYQKKLVFLLIHRNLNAGGLKVPLYLTIAGIWHMKPVTAILY